MSAANTVASRCCLTGSLWGLAYWYMLYPVHALIFSGMIRAIASRAEAGAPDADGA